MRIYFRLIECSSQDETMARTTDMHNTLMIFRPSAGSRNWVKFSLSEGDVDDDEQYFDIAVVYDMTQIQLLLP